MSVINLGLKYTCIFNVSLMSKKNGLSYSLHVRDFDFREKKKLQIFYFIFLIMKHLCTAHFSIYIELIVQTAPSNCNGLFSNTVINY